MNRYKLSQLDFSAIISFLEVAERGSFTDAATVLNLAQPTVSLHIQKLERFFGVQLLHRKSSGVFLSEEGKVFFQHCRTCLQVMEEGTLTMAKMSQTLTGTVTLGIIPSNSRSFLSKILTQYHHQYPQVHVRVLEGYTDELINQVKQGILDLAILCMPLPSEDITVEILYEEPITLVIGASHPIAKLANQDPLDPTVRIPLVMHRKNANYGVSYITEEIYRTHRDRFHIVAEVRGFQSLRQLLLDNFGAAFVSHSLVEEDIANGKLALLNVLDCPLSRQSVLISNGKLPTNHATEKLAELIRQYAHDRQ
ncbi:MAG: LysR family transcriptional regulator [Elainellaceae cyanobacterium]